MYTKAPSIIIRPPMFDRTNKTTSFISLAPIVLLYTSRSFSFGATGSTWSPKNSKRQKVINKRFADLREIAGRDQKYRFLIICFQCFLVLVLDQQI